MVKRVDLKKILFPIILIIGLFSLTDAYGAVTPQIAAGGHHTVALKTDRSLWAWGYNYFGQLGDGTTGNWDTPVKIGIDYKWSAVAAGGYHTVALKTDGALWVWGDNEFGELGDGTTTDVHSPVQIGSGSDWDQIAAGFYHTVALKTDGTLWAWGYNYYGQLGNGMTTDVHSPVQIGSGSDWDQIAAGRSHTVALKIDGTLWAWGRNNYGQLGDGTTTDVHSPVRIGSGNSWAATAAGERHTVALKTDGTLWAWGYNYYGQLGDGTTTDVHSPVQIGSGSDWDQIAAGFYHTVALKTDGTLWAWGYNYYGQLGDGTTTDVHSPVQIGSGSDWFEIGAGWYHTVALKTNGTLWAWGRNNYGQLGDGALLHRVSPFQVFSLDTLPFYLKVPRNGQEFTGCSYYDLPTFGWSTEWSFKSFEIQFSLDQSFSSAPVKVKASGTATGIEVKSSTLKKIIFMPGVEGGPVYWRVIGTKGSKETETSDVRMIWVGGAQEVGSPEISPTQKSSLQTLSWENKCNKKFKVWFGSDGSFTKKKALSFNVADPTEDSFTKQLTSSQWTGIRKLVGDVSGSTISWKVESWDGMNRHAETDVMSFVLTDYPMCEGTEGGLDAIYSNGRQAFEGPINHGWGTSCPSDPPYEHNLYQGICTPPSASPVDWAKGGWNGSSDPTGFSVSWNGYLFAPVDGAYSFGGWVDGIVYVEINGEVVANMNTIGSSYGGTVTLEGGGCVPISMSFSTNGGSNNMILNWRPPGASVSELVPRTYLRHDVGP